jgi:hypothetical protein
MTVINPRTRRDQSLVLRWCWWLVLVAAFAWLADSIAVVMVGASIMAQHLAEQ